MKIFCSGSCRRKTKHRKKRAYLDWDVVVCTECGNETAIPDYRWQKEKVNFGEPAN